MSRDVASVTLVGRAGSNPQLSFGATGDRVNFRVVATERRFDKAADDWVDGDEFGVTVICWKGLATAVLNTVRKGDPVIVAGRISTRRFEKNGATAYFTEVKADFVGLDVSKAGSRFTRNPMEPRESADLAVTRDQPPAVTDGSARSMDEPEPAAGDDFRAAWDAENEAISQRESVVTTAG